MTVEPLTIAAFTDVHYADSDDGRSALPLLGKCVDACNLLQPDLVVQLGDLIDEGEENLPAPLAALARVHAPLLHVLGNHDFAVGDGFVEAVPGWFDLDRRYYEVAIKGWRLIVLDATDLSTYANAPSSANFHHAAELLQELKQHGCINAEPWNGGIGVGQLSWLRSRLVDATRQNELVAIFCHMPAYPASRFSLYNGEEVLELLTASSCVRLFANGHAHSWCDGSHRGIRFVTIPAMVENLPPGPLTLFKLSADFVEIDRVALA